MSLDRKATVDSYVLSGHIRSLRAAQESNYARNFFCCRCSAKRNDLSIKFDALFVIVISAVPVFDKNAGRNAIASDAAWAEGHGIISNEVIYRRLAHVITQALFARNKLCRDGADHSYGGACPEGPGQAINDCSGCVKADLQFVVPCVNAPSAPLSKNQVMNYSAGLERLNGRFHGVRIAKVSIDIGDAAATLGWLASADGRDAMAFFHEAVDDDLSQPLRASNNDSVRLITHDVADPGAVPEREP